MHKSFSYVIGATLVLLGLVFLLDNLGYLDAEWIFDKFWPVLFVIAGLWLLGKRTRRGNVANGQDAGIRMSGAGIGVHESSEDRISCSEVFGNIRQEITSKHFSGGECSVVFGDIRIDLSRAELLPGEQVLRFSSVFGNIRVELPKGLEYSLKANYVFGGVNVKGARRGGVFQTVAIRSDGFLTAESRLSILASSTFGEIRIE